MPVSSTMGAAQTNINSSNIQLYGGRKVFADANAFRGDIQGMMAANREYNTYLTGLARLTGAGAGMLDKFWGIMLETQARDTETALSKSYRDMFTELSLDEKYQGAGAMGLSNAFMERKQDVYNKFLEDNPNANKRILNNIDAQLQNRYYDRVGALQTDRLTQWHIQSKINNMAETVDTACLSQLGDFNALTDIYNKSKELFGNDPIRGRTAANEGLKNVLMAWAGQSPSGFMNWSQANKSKVLQMFGGVNAKDIDQIFNHAQAKVRSDISFANSQAAHARQMILFQRQEEAYKASRYLQRQIVEHPEKPISLNQPIPELNGQTLTDTLDFSKMSGIFALANTIGAPVQVAEMAGMREKEVEVYSFMNDPNIPLPQKQEKVKEWLQDGTFKNRTEAEAALKYVTELHKKTDKEEAARTFASLIPRAETGDAKVMDEMNVLLAAGTGTLEQRRYLQTMLDAFANVAPMVGETAYKASLENAKAYIAPNRDMLGGIVGDAQRALFTQFTEEYMKLGQQLKRQYGSDIVKFRKEMAVDTAQDTEATRLLIQTLKERGQFGQGFRGVNPQGGGEWTTTGNGSSRGSRGRQTAPQTNSITLPKIAGAQAQSVRIKPADPMGVGEPPIIKR